MALRALPQNFQVPIVFRRHDNPVRLHFVEHLHVVGIELYARGHFGLGPVYQLWVAVGYGHQFCVRLSGQVFEQSPHMVVVEANYGQSGLSVWRAGLAIKSRPGG